MSFKFKNKEESCSGVDLDQYEEIETTIGELKDGDLVKGSDGRWYDIELLEVHMPTDMFEVSFETGKAKCSGDHQWTLVDDNGVSYTRETRELFRYFDFYSSMSFGSLEGPKMVRIKEIEPEESRCITVVGSKDNLFEIVLSDS